MIIDVSNFSFSAVNQAIRSAGGHCTLRGCLGQRFIASGMDGQSVEIYGVPGNALGSYLGGGEITVHGNAQDAVGDTMNGGQIVIHGSIGDAAGYAMRGGAIYVRGNAGYRAGIHMKEYEGKKPVIVIGGRAGSFLGEYQAGGLILVLGLHTDGRPAVGNFPCTGMHGGKLVLRGPADAAAFPRQVTLCPASAGDLAEIEPYVRQFCRFFGDEAQDLLRGPYTVVTPDSSNPYKQMYVAN